MHKRKLSESVSRFILSFYVKVTIILLSSVPSFFLLLKAYYVTWYSYFVNINHGKILARWNVTFRKEKEKENFHSHRREEKIRVYSPISEFIFILHSFLSPCILYLITESQSGCIKICIITNLENPSMSFDEEWHAIAKSTRIYYKKKRKFIGKFLRHDPRQFFPKILQDECKTYFIRNFENTIFQKFTEFGHNFSNVLETSKSFKSFKRSQDTKRY